MISLLSLGESMLTAGSMKSAGEGRPVPTTMHSDSRSLQVARTLSSIDLRRCQGGVYEAHVRYAHLVSIRRLFSDLIQSSLRPRKVYAPGATSAKRSPV